jgi:hypothetical protein
VEYFNDSEITEKFKSVSLCHQTVGRRVSAMPDNVSNTLRCVRNDCEYHSLGLDDSTDITDDCQIIYVRTIGKNFEIK